MTEVERIVDEMKRAEHGDPWHGAPVHAIVAGVPAHVAAARPLASAHTIWEIVLHMTSWRREVLRRVRTGIADVPVDGDWPPVTETTDGAWAAARAALAAAHDALVRAVAELPEQRLDEIVGDRRDRAAGTGVSHYVLLHGISQHDAYHAGQIALLKKVVMAG
jgi:uncharacterized damage-inducible protein DinB